MRGSSRNTGLQQELRKDILFRGGYWRAVTGFGAGVAPWKLSWVSGESFGNVKDDTGEDSRRIPLNAPTKKYDRCSRSGEAPTSQNDNEGCRLFSSNFYSAQTRQRIQKR